jgi:hypothetical protein
MALVGTIILIGEDVVIVLPIALTTVLLAVKQWLTAMDVIGILTGILLEMNIILERGLAINVRALPVPFAIVLDIVLVGMMPHFGEDVMIAQPILLIQTIIVRPAARHTRIAMDVTGIHQLGNARVVQKHVLQIVKCVQELFF